MLIAETVVCAPTAPAGTLIVCRGLPASGKSTYAEAWVAEAPEVRARVNRDTIRRTYFNSYWGPSVDEAAVTDIAVFVLSRLVRAGRHVIVDDTNLSVDRLEPVLRLGRAKGYRVVVADFDAPFDELVARDQARSKPVGETVIRSLRERAFVNGRLPELEKA